MTKSDPDLRLLPSLLDRLTAPSGGPTTIGTESDRPVQLDQLRDQVKRDLECLLNSKRAVPDFPHERDHLNHSLLTFGLPDFSGKSLSALLGGDLRAAVDQAIRRFEPRLSRVEIQIDEDRPSAHALRFRINALLKVEPMPEPITFDTVLELDTRKFEVRGGAG